MHKTEMDSFSIVKYTEWTRFRPRTDKVKPVCVPFYVVETGDIMMLPRPIGNTYCHTYTFCECWEWYIEMCYESTQIQQDIHLITYTKYYENDIILSRDDTEDIGVL